LTPLSSQQEKLLQKLLLKYEEDNVTVKVTYEIVVKNINEQQKSLYKAFIIKAADHFGDTFNGMENKLKRFMPEDKNLSKWSTKELDDFINKSTFFLAEFGFHF